MALPSWCDALGNPRARAGVACPDSGVRGRVLRTAPRACSGAAAENAAFGFVIFSKTGTETGLISSPRAAPDHRPPRAKRSRGAAATGQRPRRCPRARCFCPSFVPHPPPPRHGACSPCRGPTGSDGSQAWPRACCPSQSQQRCVQEVGAAGEPLTGWQKNVRRP